MTDDMRRYLTEFLGETWFGKYKTHADDCKCNSCLDYVQCNRPFNRRDDMMDLYQELHRKDRMTVFWVHSWLSFAAEYGPISEELEGAVKFPVCLFCLDGEGYNDRCRIVYKFLKENGSMEEKAKETPIRCRHEDRSLSDYLKNGGYLSTEEGPI